MPNLFKESLKKLLFGASRFRFHYSQSGEDIILISIIREIVKVKSGFYVDVGAFHPTLSSNTFYLYQNGWNGINIEPRPGSKKIFDKERPRDINLEVGVGATNGKLKYYFIDENSSLNSFSKKALEDNKALDKVKKVIDCNVITLNDVFKDYVPHDKKIDFLNIDAEGFEIEVISTINWNLNRPKIIAIEQNSITSLNDVAHSETGKLLAEQNYIAVAKNVVSGTVATVFYVDNIYL